MPLITAGALLLLGLAQTQSLGADLPSSMIIESLRGSVMIGDDQAEKHQVVLASGNKIETGEDSFVAVVLSNGLSIYCGPESHLEITEAHQEAFADFYAASEFEDSVSTIELKLVEGGFGFDQPDPNPTSTLSIETRYGEIEGDASSFAIVLGNREGKVGTLNGSLYFISDQDKRRFVAEDEALDLAMASQEASARALTPLRATGREVFRPLVEPAERARKRVLITEVDGAATFKTVITPESTDGAAFNDYRLPR
ncbi:hypothetical protein [Rubellicoccus peritrichatus]|uniref:DUF4412 domain-containing protein n=1 Tax=Rubellicoccus peritrichatus TaxID=3080537 RepID=A0AAQ3L9L5_9BACT|nr:hypothetical protein [Puniceicoccus sp. CR14]WOO41900.1 hypothetical protein RZN69_02285 [Puniceicoccus sp. CR14]